MEKVVYLAGKRAQICISHNVLQHTQDWQLSQGLLLHYCLPGREVSMAINNRPEKQPIKMSDMIHDDQATLLEMTFEPKRTNLYTKHFFCITLCVRERKNMKYVP